MARALGPLASARLLLLGTPAERPWTNCLLVFIPLAVASGALWSAGATFALTLAALVPLAERLGFCTEQLAEYVPDTVAGLMNASMGNAPELIIALFALRAHLVAVTAASLLGSILSNLLLVLGTSLLVGGLAHFELRFSTALAPTHALLLGACAAAHALATAAARAGAPAADVLRLSRAAAAVLLALYAAFLVFQLRTHARLFDDGEGEGEGEGEGGGAAAPRAAARDAAADAAEGGGAAAGAEGAETAPLVAAASAEGAGAAPLARGGAAAAPPAPEAGAQPGGRLFSAATPPAAAGGGVAGKAAAAAAADGDVDDGNGDDDEPTRSLAAAAADGGGEPRLSFLGSVVALAVVAALVAVLSEVLTASIEAGAAALGLSERFVCTILTPIAGNAAEHWSAVTFARKNRLDVSLGIAVGSSVQIGLFLMPLMTLVGGAWGEPLSYDFGALEAAALAASVLLAAAASAQGRAHWMQGAVLLAAYAIVCAGFLVVPPPAV